MYGDQFVQDSYPNHHEPGYEFGANDSVEHPQFGHDGLYESEEFFSDQDDANKTTESLGGVDTKKCSKKQATPKKSVTKRIIKNYPGETKNLPKNLCRALKGFLETVFTSSQIQQNSSLRSFMNKSKQKCGKEDLDHFLRTDIGRQMGNLFYGNFKFTGFFVRENKVNLDSYFRILDEYFLPNTENDQ